MVTIGTRDTNTIQSERRVVDMADKIALLQPSASPLAVLLMKLQKKVAINPKFSWLEDDLLTRWDAINNGAGYAAGALSLVVDDGDIFTANDLVKVPRTAEVMKVSSVATNTLTVVRGYGTTLAAALVDDDPLLIIGNANEEGANSPTPKTTQTTAPFNYCQIFRTPFGVTETTNASKLYGGNDLAYQRKKKGIEHAVDIERALFFGEKKEDLTGTHPRRATAGIISFVTTLVQNISGDMTEEKFETFLRDLFLYGSDVKFVFCSPLIISALSSFAQGRLQMIPKDQTYGIAITRWVSPHGEVNLIKHRLLEGAIYGGYAVGVDLKNLWYRPLQGRDTKLKTNIQANDADEEKDEYITEAGLELNLEKTHGWMYGCTGY